jgi:hypothetical protein
MGTIPVPLRLSHLQLIEQDDYFVRIHAGYRHLLYLTALDDSTLPKAYLVCSLY